MKVVQALASLPSLLTLLTVGVLSLYVVGGIGPVRYPEVMLPRLWEPVRVVVWRHEVATGWQNWVAESLDPQLRWKIGYGGDCWEVYSPEGLFIPCGYVVGVPLE